MTPALLPGPAALGPVVDRFASMLVDVLLGFEEAGFVEGHPEIETALVEPYRPPYPTPTSSNRRGTCSGAGATRPSAGQLLPRLFSGRHTFRGSWLDPGARVRGLVPAGRGHRYLYRDRAGRTSGEPIFSQWDDMTSAQDLPNWRGWFYATNEAFGERFELPPDRAYCERCAAIASIMWNWRLLLLTGEARYAELIERTLVQRLPSWDRLDGTSFFYVNPSPGPCAHAPPPVVRLCLLPT